MSTAAASKLKYPYPGFRPFEEWESEIFFGRDGQTEKMLDKLAQQHFLAVVGTSGSGKSSLVKAGMLPAIRGGLLPEGGTRWRIATFQPTGDPHDNPFGNLAAAAGLDADELRAHTLGLIKAAAESLAPGEKLLVVADQFEEVFKCDPEEAARFVTGLIEASRQRTVPVYVVLTMRSEFLGQCARFRDLPERINEAQYLVPRMTREERREAITGPAAAMSLQLTPVTPRLVEMLLDRAGDDPEQLPRLQHLLLRMWILADGKPLDIVHYEAAGGWDGALSNHLDAIFDGLKTARLQQIAKKMFQRLAEPGPEGAVVRVPASRDELCGLVEPRTTLEEVDAVIAAFSAEGATFLRSGTKVNVSHESLFRVWKKMRGSEGWVALERRGERIYQRLLESVDRREKTWSGPRLEEALQWWGAEHPTRQWAERYGGRFDEAARLIRRSRTNRRWRRAGYVAVPVACLTVAVVFLILWSRAKASEKRATEASRTAKALQLAAQSQLLMTKLGANPVENQTRAIAAAALGIRSLQAKWLPEGGEGALKNAIESVAIGTVLEGVSGVSLSPDAEYVAGLRWNGFIPVIMRTADGATVASDFFKRAGTPQFEFSRDSQSIAAGTTEGMCVFEVATGTQKQCWPLEYAESYSIQFSPDGKWLAAIPGPANGGRLLIFNVSSKKEPAPLEGGFLGFDHDAQSALFGSGPSGVERVNLRTHVQQRLNYSLLKVSVNSSDFYNARISPDGRLLATWSESELKVYDLTTGGRDALFDRKVGTSSPLEPLLRFNFGLLFSFSFDGARAFWVQNVIDTRTGKDLYSASGIQGFTREGMFAWGSAGQQLQIRDAESGEVVWSRNVPAVVSVEFSKTDQAFVIFDRVISSASNAPGGSLLHEPLHSKDLIDRACHTLPRNPTRQEWDQYVNDGPYQKVCKNLP